MSNRDRKARNSPIYSKSPIERPARAAVPSRSRSDPSHIHAISPSESSASNSEAFPPMPITATPPPQESQSLAPPNFRASLVTTRSTSSSISYNGPASSSMSVHSQSEVDKDSLMARLSTSAAHIEASLLTELSQLSTKYAEVAEELDTLKVDHAHLQDSWTGLNYDFVVIRDDNVRLRREVEEREEMERESKTRISSLIIDRETQRGRYEAARASAHDKTEEVGLLRSQVQGLKRWVSSSGRSEGQITDSAVNTSLSDLAAGLQNWVLKHFRRSKLKPVEEIEEDIRSVLDELCPSWEAIMETGMAKVHLMQSLVSRFLVTRVFDAYLVGLPEEQEAQLKQFEKWLRESSQDTADVNKWRAATLGALNKGSLIEKFKERTAEVIDELASEIMVLLKGIIVNELLAEQVTTSLKALIGEAVSLHRTLRVQKALFTLHMPDHHAFQILHFDAETMEDISGEDDETLQEREVLCVTFPGVVKEGDEMGERTELRNCVAKAKVLCVGD